MEAYKIETTIQPDGSLTLARLPFQAGERVEIIVLPAAEARAEDTAYSLRGTAYRYDDPTEPVVPEEWEAAQ